MSDTAFDASIPIQDMRFFKYVSRATGLAVLESRKLRWSTPGTLNDPYDMQFDLRVDVDRHAVKAAALQRLWAACYREHPAQIGNQLGELIKALRGKFPRLAREEFDVKFGEAIDLSLTNMLDRALPDMQAAFRAELATSKILCLTESDDNPAMWVHYAEQHRGVVFRFRSVPSIDSPWVTARQIQYLKDTPHLLDNNFLADMLSGRFSMDVKTIMNHMIYTKSTEWAYEREWRIYSGSGRDAGATYEDIHFHELELDGVIVGYRMPPEDRSAFSELVKKSYSRAELLQAERSTGAFRLNIGPLQI